MLHSRYSSEDGHVTYDRTYNLLGNCVTRDQINALYVQYDGRELSCICIAMAMEGLHCSASSFGGSFF